MLHYGIQFNELVMTIAASTNKNVIGRVFLDGTDGDEGTDANANIDVTLNFSQDRGTLNIGDWTELRLQTFYTTYPNVICEGITEVELNKFLEENKQGVN